MMIFIAFAYQLKSKGNTFYKLREYHEAIASYHSALDEIFKEYPQLKELEESKRREGPYHRRTHKSTPSPSSPSSPPSPPSPLSSSSSSSATHLTKAQEFDLYKDAINQVKSAEAEKKTQDGDVDNVENDSDTSRPTNEPQNSQSSDTKEKDNTQAKENGNIEADPIPQKFILLYCSLHSNLAVCHLKREAYNMTVNHSSRTLSFDPDHKKALYRRSVAHEKLEKYSEATEDMRLLSNLDSSFKPELERLTNLRNEDLKNKAKKVWG